LHRVPDAPEFLYPAYAVYAASADAKVVAPALAGLRHVAGAAAGAAKARANRPATRRPNETAHSRRHRHGGST
jgi:hypothetical protein